MEESEVSTWRLVTRREVEELQPGNDKYLQTPFTSRLVQLELSDMITLDILTEDLASQLELEVGSEEGGEEGRKCR